MEDRNEQNADNQALLDAISRNAECAHVLAAIAQGGDARELVQTLLGQQDAEVTPEIQESTENEKDSEVPMFTAPAAPIAEASEPVIILNNVEPDFWEFFN